MSFPFTATPPRIPGDANLSSLSVSDFISSYGVYANEPIDGVPVAVSSSGMMGAGLTTGKIFPVGVTPAGSSITPDGSKLYIANNNNYGISGSDSVTVINLINNVVLTTITDPSFDQPYTVTISPDGSKAYVTNSYSTTITVINTATNTVTGTITGFNGPSGMVIKDTTAYVNNYGAGESSGTGNTVSIVDLTVPEITGTITVGPTSSAPAAIALSVDQRYLYVALYETGTTNSGFVKVYDTNSGNTLVATIPNFSGPFAIAINPNGLKVYVTNFGSNNFTPYGTTVSVIDTNTYTVTNTITVGIQPAGAAVSPNGKFLYVTNYNTLYAGMSFTNLTAGDGTVSIIDTASETVVSPTIKVSQSPSFITIDPQGQFAYVTNYTSNTVSGIYINQG